MKRINPGFLFPLMALCLLVIILSRPLFMVPPAGKMLNPFSGAVQNDESAADYAGFYPLPGSGLSDTVDIYYDSRMVPHIYASTPEDLFFAQGYAAARMRLWQMDFVSFLSAGRLSEIAAAKPFLDYDRNQRRMGMLSAARKTVQFIEKDPQTHKLLSAYTRGVNAWISRLGSGDIPFEYKFLNYRPEPWSNLKSVLVMKYMTAILSGYEDDYAMSNMMLVLGEERFNRLFPDFPAFTTPVVNTGRRGAAPVIAKPGYLDYAFMSSGSVIPPGNYNPHLGSNSWAVSGAKTVTGNPVLCSDPHLNLTLPSVWMEMQLTAPGFNVYGVSIPGTPSVILGFNENIAWGVTNGSDDVKDWYKLKINSSYTHYELDGKWVPFRYEVEEIRRKDRPVFYDTVYYTVHGPVVSNRGFQAPGGKEYMDYALKWTLHDASNEFLTFIKLAGAKNYTDYREAISTYGSPVQNFTFACKDNTIAINHQGRIPLKRPGQGRFIGDGTRSEELCSTYIPADSLPAVYNPASSYVLSANQQPVYPGGRYYYNGFFKEVRAARIDQLLREDTLLSIEKMKTIQTDNVNFFAVQALPVLLGSTSPSGLDDHARKLLAGIALWKGSYNMNDAYAKLYELWWQHLKKYTWDEFSGFSFRPVIPPDHVLLDLLMNDSQNIYFDQLSTPVRENAAGIVQAAFKAAAADMAVLNGEGKKTWADFNQVTLMHLGNIRALGINNLPSAGNPDAPNAMSAGWGPSWRMIVELGDRPKGYGIYAGGQSGNIGGPYFTSFVQDWNKGVYYPLEFYMSAAEAGKNTKYRCILK